MKGRAIDDSAEAFHGRLKFSERSSGLVSTWCGHRRSAKTPLETKRESTVFDGRGPPTKPLSVDEILGNVFVFNFAGDDTTAIPLATSVLLLVARRAIQHWMWEEFSFYLEADQKEN